MTDKTVKERIERIASELAKTGFKEVLVSELEALVVHAKLEYVREPKQTSPLVHEQCTSDCRKNGCPNDK